MQWMTNMSELESRVDLQSRISKLENLKKYVTYGIKETKPGYTIHEEQNLKIYLNHYLR